MNAKGNILSRSKRSADVPSAPAGETPALPAYFDLLILLSLILLAAFVLSACSATNEAPPATIPPTSLPADTASGSPADTASGSPADTSASLDFATLDTCALIPPEDIASVIGALRGEPAADPPNGSEKGCLYFNEEGNFADVILGPASDWDLLRQLQPEAEDFTLNGDAAFAADKPDAANLWVLRPGQTVIHVRVSSGDREQAQQLVAKVITQLP